MAEGDEECFSPNNFLNFINIAEYFIILNELGGSIAIFMKFFFSVLVFLGSIQSAMQEPVLPGKLIIWVLFVLSIVSWVMIISKSLQLRRMKKADRRFSSRLRQSKTTLEVFEEGWRDEDSLQLVIYQAGARETAFQLLGSRNPTAGVAQDIREAGVLTSGQQGFLEAAFRAGFRTAAAKLEAGVRGLRVIGVAAIMMGLLGGIWTLMVGFDGAGDSGVPAGVVGSALGFLVIALLVATPAFVGRLALAMVIDKRHAEIVRFRDDISRLFERKFTNLESPGRRAASSKSPRSDDSPDDPENDGQSTGKKKYHSIRDRLLNLPDDPEEENGNEIAMNPIARQAATLKPRT